MGIETFEYIDDLNAANPTATDNVSEGDDHLRGLKTTLKNTFPNVTGAITATEAELNYVDGVTSNIQTQLGNKEPADATIVKDADIGVTIQAYDANTAKIDTAQAFTEDQTFEAITETKTTKSASFTPDLSNDGTLYSCTGTMTVTMPTAESGKSFTIIHATATSITWAGTIKWNGGAEPAKGAGIDIYVFVSDGTNWYGMQSGTGFA